jgi:hypothetical protein
VAHCCRAIAKFDFLQVHVSEECLDDDVAAGMGKSHKEVMGPLIRTMKKKYKLTGKTGPGKDEQTLTFVRSFCLFVCLLDDTFF